MQIYRASFVYPPHSLSFRLGTLISLHRTLRASLMNTGKKIIDLVIHQHDQGTFLYLKRHNVGIHTPRRRTERA